MVQFEVSYPQMTYNQVVTFCKECAEEIRAEGVDVFVSDYGAATNLLDVYFYPLEMQEWINKEETPQLYIIIMCVYLLENNHTDRASWEKLLELIDSL